MTEMKNEELKTAIKELSAEFKKKMSSYPIDVLEHLMKVNVELDGSTVLTTSYAMALFRGKSDKDKAVFEDDYIPLKVIVKYDGVIEYILDYTRTMDDNERYKSWKEVVQRLRTYSEYLEMLNELRSAAANDMKKSCALIHASKGVPVVYKITEDCDTASADPVEWKLRCAIYVCDANKGEISFDERECHFSSLFGHCKAIDSEGFNEVISDTIHTIVSRIERQERRLSKEKRKYNDMLKDALIN